MFVKFSMFLLSMTLVLNIFFINSLKKMQEKVFKELYKIENFPWGSSIYLPPILLYPPRFL